MERNSSLGYIAFGKEVTKGTAVIPDIFAPLYSESLATAANFVRDNAIIGTKFKHFLTVQGNRDHTGDFEVLGDPNIAGYVMAAFMSLVSASESGADPYTHPYIFDPDTNPASLTVDISYKTHVVRFFGLEIGTIEPVFDNGEMHLKCSDVQALGCWGGREVASTSGTNPYTVVFKTAYDQNATKGLKIGDTMQLFDVSAGTYTAFTIASIPDGTSITTTTDVTAGASGDFVTIAPQTPSLDLLTPFTWGNTQVRIAADATTALSATHTPVEPDSVWKLMHPFDSTANQHRSGSFDPAALPRLQGDVELKIRKYFDTPGELQRFQALEKRAVVWRHYAYTTDGKTYELRITINNMKVDNPQPHLAPDTILYSELTYMPEYDVSDTQGADVKVIDAIATH